MMTRFKYILLLTAAVMAVKGYAATFPTLSFVKTDGSHLTVSVDGLKITYDDFAHAIITNNDTNLTIDLADLKYMYFGTEDTNTHITGDVNDDGEVNIADINTAIDQILSGDFTATGDVNGDGEVNIADINAIIDIILAN